VTGDERTEDHLNGYLGLTGAASGIGLGIATALAEAGANVVMADIQKDAVVQAARGLSGTNKRVMPVRIDVTQEQSVVDALTEAERNFGKLEATLTERLATTGLDPKKAGERVLDAIRTKTFYAFVSAVPADVIKARHRRIEDALNSPWVSHY
jgi:NAD(P)-dependent dehydrogenase (short-subunit alcohol dehydrogenase family)